MTVEKIAIITAGGSGMGAAAARRLAADGFKVAVLSSSGKGEALAQELGGFGVTGSNQSNDDLKRLVDGTLERWGRIDVLVNSAGHGPRKQILEITDEDWHAGFDTYFLNVVRPARLVAPTMQKQKGGVIINISTAWAFEPSAIGKSMLRWNRPDCAFIGGPAEAFTTKDHLFAPGAAVAKSLVVLNDRRRKQSVAWTWRLPIASIWSVGRCPGRSGPASTTAVAWS